MQIFILIEKVIDIFYTLFTQNKIGFLNTNNKLKF